VQNAAATAGWSRGQDGVSTLRLSYDNFTGCLFDAVWMNSSWQFSCTRLYTVSQRRTSPTTACWWRKSVDVCDRLMHGHVLYRGPGPSLVTEVLMWLVHGSGTVYRLHCVTLTSFASSESNWRRIILFSGGCREWWLCFSALQILYLTYLLTYLYTCSFFLDTVYIGYTETKSSARQSLGGSTGMA